MDEVDKLASDEANAIYCMYVNRCAKIISNQFKVLTIIIKDNNE